MKNSKLTLFESKTANFRLSLDTMYEKQNQDGSSSSLVYINSEKGTGTFRPSCFLVFTYLTDDFTTTKGIYTTVPHIYKIRQAFSYTHDQLHNPEAFVHIDGSLGVSPNFAEPITIANLNLRTGDWISLTLTTVCTGENMVSAVPGVAVQHSKSNGYSSLLTMDEFDTIYDLIMHIDFVTVENQAVIIELLSRATSTGNTNQVAPQYHQAATRTPYQTAPRTTAPAYQTSRYSAPQVAQRGQAQPAPRVKAPEQPVAQQTQAPIPPRPASSPKITMDAVKDIPVEEIDLGDTSSIDDIFGEI